MTHVERAGAPRRRNILEDRVEEARELYDQGNSLAKIGQRVGVNASTVWHAFRKAEIPMRDTHGR
jgi:transposase-like protein